MQNDSSRWQIYNIDNVEELCFVDDNMHQLQDQNFDKLIFCPVIHNNDIVLATSDKKQVKVNL